MFLHSMLLEIYHKISVLVGQVWNFKKMDLTITNVEKFNIAVSYSVTSCCVIVMCVCMLSGVLLSGVTLLVSIFWASSCWVPICKVLLCWLFWRQSKNVLRLFIQKGALSQKRSQCSYDYLYSVKALCNSVIRKPVHTSPVRGIY